MSAPFAIAGVVLLALGLFLFFVGFFMGVARQKDFRPIGALGGGLISGVGCVCVYASIIVLTGAPT